MSTLIRWRRKRHGAKAQGPRPPFTIRHEWDYPAAVQRVDDLVRVEMDHRNPLAREQARFDEALEAMALGEFLETTLATIEPRYRQAVERALRNWEWRTTVELRPELEQLRFTDMAALRQPGASGQTETYPVGTRLAHPTDTVWTVIDNDLPGDGSWHEHLPALAGDCLIGCDSVPDGRRRDPRVGQRLRAHRYYLHCALWRPVAATATV